MFRECYFEYAGQSSQPYNLMLTYVSNNNTDFDSGGKFDLKTDALPRSHETLLYGKDYSAQPLSFEIEILNVDDYIPLEQMAEIKNWLFGQNGWKSLKILDERQDYFLKCILSPIEDIVDGSGYRGVRCTLQNASPFWYGEQRTITIDRATLHNRILTASDDDEFSFFEVNIPDDIVEVDIHPQIYLQDRRYEQSSIFGDYECWGLYRLVTVDASSASTATLSSTVLSQFVYNADYLPKVSSDSNWDASHGAEDIHCDTLYGTLYSTNTYWNSTSSKPLWSVLQFGNTWPQLFTLHRGKNVCMLKDPKAYKQIEFTYTPMYRLGAF